MISATVAEHTGTDLLGRARARLPASINTDRGRLRQVLKNLLVNAFKFTEHGEVSCGSTKLMAAGRRGTRRLGAAESVTSFSVSDTGIGHHAGHCSNASSRPSRRGTARRPASTAARAWPVDQPGAGPSARGRDRAHSTPEQGSTFTVYLPSAPARDRGRHHWPRARLLRAPRRRVEPSPSAAGLAENRSGRA